MSAKAAEVKRDQAKTPLGVLDWVDKPLDHDRLLASVGRAVRGSTDPTILYMEDDADLTGIVSTLLEDSARIVSVQTLAEAKEALGRERFDLIIMDIGLPDGSGLDLLDDIHEDGHSQIPVIIFSAHEVGPSVAARVEAALIKSRTTNEKLVDTVMSLISHGDTADFGSE